MTISSIRAIPALLALQAIVVASASAALVNVTTTNDGIGIPGVSLREAMNTANTDGEATTIVLTAGATYQLTVCGIHEDANATGDLDHTATHPLTINGNGAIIVQTCAGDRIFHNHAAGAEVVFNDVTITGGNVGLVEFGGGIWMDAGDLQLHGCTILDNAAGESGGGVQMDNGNLTITNSTFQGNTSGLPGGAIEFSSNTAALTITDSVFHQNEGDLGGAIAAGTATSLTIAGCTFTENDANDGAALYLGVIDSGLIIASTFENNTGENAIHYRDLRDPTGFDPHVVFDQCTIAQNNVAGGAAIVVDTDDRILLLRNTTVSGNSGIGIDVIEEGILELVHATVVRNTGLNVQALGFGELRTTASIIADAQGAGARDCGLAIGADSGGYNFSGDGTCGLGLGTGDVSFGGDPKLASLNNNGGPTRTHAPYADSSVVNYVPVAVSTALLGPGPTDQRGVARPAGVACEIGAYEGNLLVNAPDLAIVIVGNDEVPTPADDLIVAKLRRLRINVVLVDDHPLPPWPWLSSSDLVLIAPSAATRLPGMAKLRKLSVPVIVMNPAFYDDLGLTKSGSSNAGHTPPTTTIKITNAHSPLAARLSGVVTVASTPAALNFGIPSPSAEVIATHPGRGAPPVLFAYESGARIQRGKAPARRIGFFTSGPALRRLSSDGEKLLDAAIEWALTAPPSH